MSPDLLPSLAAPTLEEVTVVPILQMRRLRSREASDQLLFSGVWHQDRADVGGVGRGLFQGRGIPPPPAERTVRAV